MSQTFPLPQLPRIRRAAGSGDPATETTAQIAKSAPRVPWDRFVRDRFAWRTGEHVALIGPTGQGKTNMLLNILPLKPFTVVFATKPKDETVNRLISQGYTRIPAWRPMNPIDEPRRVLWPESRDIDSDAIQRSVFRDAFARIYREGGWTIALDEAWYMANVLNLQREMRMILLQGRSIGISLVSATQRPKYVPLEIYDQSTHLFFWRDNDRENLDRLAGINVASSDLLRRIIPNLERFQVVYVNTRTGEMVRTRAPAPGRNGNGSANGA